MPQPVSIKTVSLSRIRIEYEGGKLLIFSPLIRYMQSDKASFRINIILEQIQVIAMVARPSAS
jgi:hypothetical protein